MRRRTVERANEHAQQLRRAHSFFLRCFVEREKFDLTDSDVQTMVSASVWTLDGFHFGVVRPKG